MSGPGEGPAPDRAVTSPSPGGDPMGKRALFWVPATPAEPPAEGRRALFSDSPAGEEQGWFLLRCSRCWKTRRVGLLWTALHYPFGLWVWRQEFDHFLRCPMCRHWAWLSITDKE